MEEVSIYRESIWTRIKRIIKRILIFGFLIGLTVLGLKIRNLIEEASYPPLYGNQIVSDLDQLTPDTKALAEEFLARCQAEGLEVKITETYRTQGRQNQLYAQGREIEGPRVTWTRNSLHTRRRAFDIAKEGDDPYGDLEFFERCAEIGEEVGLEAGHYWRVKDSPHFQNFNWWNYFWY